MDPRRRKQGTAHARGMAAEDAACAALLADGWEIRARRRRTPAGEIDILAERHGILAIVEVKARPRLSDAAAALTSHQRTRLLAAAELVLAEHPDWGQEGVRFDLVVVDDAGRVRRITDAFRWEA
jgi:putative endonuclease